MVAAPVLIWSVPRRSASELNATFTARSRPESAAASSSASTSTRRPDVERTQFENARSKA